MSVSEETPRFRPPRRAETLPVRFADVNLIDGGPTTMRPGEHVRFLRERSAFDLPPPSLSRRSSSYVQTQESQPDVVTPERRERVRQSRRNRMRYRRQRDRSRSRRRIVESDEDGSIENDSSEDDYTSSSTSEIIKSRSRELRYRDDSDSTSEEELDVNDDAYAFNLPRHSQRPLSQEPTVVGSDSSSEFQVAVAGSRLGTQLRVYRSKYAGEGLIGEPHSVKLAAIQDLKKGRSPLFRWIHFEDPTMNFDEFQKGAMQTSGLTDIERAGISKLLGRVRKKYDKPLQMSKGARVRYMEPSCLQESLSPVDQPKEKISKPRVVTWICMPYFCLEAYSGTLSDAKASAHPMRTLMQARFSMTRKERDMTQVVGSIFGTPRGFCFHVAQIWLLILGDSLLVTSARMPMSALRRKSILLDLLPELSPAEPPGILVSYGDSVLWRFGLDECQTWFAFLSNFREFWPRRYRITYNGTILTADLWSQVLDVAKRSSKSIRLQFQLGGIAKTQIRGVLKRSYGHAPQGKPDSAPTPTADVVHDQAPSFRSGKPLIPRSSLSKGFHVFTWLNAGRADYNGRSSMVDDDQTLEDLEYMDQFLSHETQPSEQNAYMFCPKASRIQVYAVIENEKNNTTAFTNQNKEEERKQKVIERRIDLVNAAQSVFEFFFALSFEGPTVQKYWGALYRLLEGSSLERLQDHSKNSKRKWRGREVGLREGETLALILDWLETIVRHTQPFMDLFSQATPTDRQYHVEIPDELLKAWLHLIMSLIQCTRESTIWEEHIVKTSSLIDQGLKKIVHSLTSKSIIEQSVFMPFDLALLISLEHLPGITGTQPDVAETYREYLSSLETEIETHPLERSHQDKLQRLKQEIDVIKNTLRNQSQIFFSVLDITKSGYSSREAREVGNRGYALADAGYHADYSRATRGGERSRSYVRDHLVRSKTYARGYSDDPVYVSTNMYTGNASEPSQSQLQPTDPGGYRELLLQDCIEFLDKRDLDFSEMRDKATELEAWNIQQIDTNRDRQESALYAFTIVTVIFLPLSTVASILGMNTADIRSMQFSQWVFWAVALPVTFVIIVLSLIWTDELGNFWRGFSRLWKGERGENERPAVMGSYGDGRSGRGLRGLLAVPAKDGRNGTEWVRARAPYHHDQDEEDEYPPAINIPRSSSSRRRPTHR